MYCYGRSGKSYEREHVQFNSQDLDQEQNVHLDPVQLNTQNIQVILARDDYSCVITGNTYKGKNRYIAADVNILLFFGYEGNVPVHKTKSDSNGNFRIEGLPPGFYCIAAQYSESPVERHLIKLLPGQTLHQTFIF